MDRSSTLLISTKKLIIVLDECKQAVLLFNSTACKIIKYYYLIFICSILKFNDTAFTNII